MARHDAVNAATAARGPHVSVDAVRVEGAPAGVTGASFGHAVRRALHGALDAGGQGVDPARIDRLSIRLRAGATEKEIAMAIARAIARQAGGNRR